ncbi:MAG: hypothetical protein Q9182_003852 [Xanthomendoza sp. 2 TL-2023]
MGSTTVIIGAGVRILYSSDNQCKCLCTAYHLAKTIDEDATEDRVLVVEAAGSVFAATSSTNTGVLSELE